MNTSRMGINNNEELSPTMDNEKEVEDQVEYAVKEVARRISQSLIEPMGDDSLERSPVPGTKKDSDNPFLSPPPSRSLGALPTPSSTQNAASYLLHSLGKGKGEVSEPAKSKTSAWSIDLSEDFKREQFQMPNLDVDADQGPTTAPKKQVRFNCVTIRKYPYILGDNPSCSSGPPVSIDWTYSEPKVMSLSHFDHVREPKRRHGQEALAMKFDTRIQLLTRMGYSEKEIVEATRKTIRAQVNRRQTVQNMNLHKYQETFESVTKKLKKVWGIRR